MKPASGTVSSRIDFETLKQNFHLPMSQVAQDLGVCATVLKKLCRQYNIPRWPHRKIKSLNKMIQALQETESDTEEQEKQRLSELNALLQKKADIMENPRIIGPTYSRMSKTGASNPNKSSAAQKSKPDQSRQEKNVLLMLEQQRYGSAQRSQTPVGNDMSGGSCEDFDYLHKSQPPLRPRSAGCYPVPQSANYQPIHLSGTSSVPPKFDYPRNIPNNFPIHSDWIRPIPVQTSPSYTNGSHTSSSYMAPTGSSTPQSGTMLNPAPHYLQGYSNVRTCFSPPTIVNPAGHSLMNSYSSVSVNHSGSEMAPPSQINLHSSYPTDHYSIKPPSLEHFSTILSSSSFDRNEYESELCGEPLPDIHPKHDHHSESNYSDIYPESQSDRDQSVMNLLM